MPMKSPSHPGRIIKTALDELDVSVPEAAEALGISPQALRDVVEGFGIVSPELAVRLEGALGSSAATWLRLQMHYDLAKVRDTTEPFQVRPLGAHINSDEPRRI